MLKHRSRHDPDPARAALLEQLAAGRLLDQRVAARDHQQIDDAGAHPSQQGLRRLGADADGTDHPLVAQPDQGSEAVLEGRLEVVLFGVVQIQDVDRVQPHPLERRNSERVASSSRSAVSGLGRSSRPTFVDTT